MLPKQLMFTVGLIDQITKPIANITKGFNGLTSNYQRGTMQMASGIAGIAASGYALQNALMPAIEMDRALGEVKSLGVRESALKQLAETASLFSIEYGKSATEFVRSSYDIQSAISGLSDADLSAFTLSSNVLAAATKADADTITSYMGVMYGIFKNQAIGMGKTNWVEQVTGMTSTAVEMFRTTGAGMSGAFTAIGAEATSAGIGMNEQMAILGTLQSTYSGSEAGTKYRAFLAGVGKAQNALGLTFTDSAGRMLPMVNILEKIKGKYGDTLEVAESDELTKAFGSKEAVSTVKLLMNDIDGLNGSIKDLGKVKGMEQAEKMAAAMTDQSERLSQSWTAIKRTFGMAILPMFNSFASWLSSVGSDVVWFTKTFPNLTKFIGYTTVAIIAMIAAGGLFTLVMGASKMAMVAWGVAAMSWSGITAALTLGLSGLRSVLLAVNIAMFANPIGLIVAGIALAVAAVAGLIYYWDELKESMSNVSWMSFFLGPLKASLSLLKLLFDGVSWVIDKIADFAGVDIDLNSSSSTVASIAAVAPIKSQAQTGGITQQISNANQQKSTSIGNVTVYQERGAQNFVEQLEMQS